MKLKLADKIEQIRQKEPQDQTIENIRQRNWERFRNRNNEDFFNEIFDGNESINISRRMILNESSPQKKVLETILWGYPTSWPNRTMQSVVDNLKCIVDSLSSNCEDNYTALININGLGWSTLTKLLYFFNCKIENNQCLILDRIVRSAALSFSDFENINMKSQSIETYCSYIKIMNEKANAMKVFPDQIELFLFEEGKK